MGFRGYSTKPRLLPHQDLRDTWGWINPTPEIPPLWIQLGQPCPQLFSFISPLSSLTPATEFTTTSEQRAQLLLWTLSSHTGPRPSKQSVQQAPDVLAEQVPFTRVAESAVMKGQIPGQAEATSPPTTVTATSQGVWPGPKNQFWSTLGSFMLLLILANMVSSTSGHKHWLKYCWSIGRFCNQFMYLTGNTV